MLQGTCFQAWMPTLVTLSLTLVVVSRFSSLSTLFVLRLVDRFNLVALFEVELIVYIISAHPSLCSGDVESACAFKPALADPQLTWMLGRSGALSRGPRLSPPRRSSCTDARSRTRSRQGPTCQKRHVLMCDALSWSIAPESSTASPKPYLVAGSLGQASIGFVGSLQSRSYVP